MHTDPHDPDNAIFDGGDLTEEEARLVAEGVEEKEPGTDAPAGEGGEAAINPAEGDGEAARAQAAAEDAAAVPGAIDAAAAVQDAPAPAPIPDVPARPEAPKDFDAAFNALSEQYNDGELDIVDYNKQVRDLTLEQSRYERQIEDWERAQQYAQQAAERAAQDDWNAAALAFERANQEFLANPLRHKVMQDAINTVIQGGEQLSNQQLLDKALAIAVDYTGWKAPEQKTPQDQRAALGDALKNRKPGAAPQTLGDAPQAANEIISGNETFDTLDRLPIGDLEAAFAQMTPAQQEKYLAEAPGANANGRD